VSAGKADLVLVSYKQRDRAYAVSHSHVSITKTAPEDISKRLSDSQQGMAKAVEAEVETWTAIVQDGYPGREFTMRKADNYAAKARVIYANGVLYQAIVLVKDDNLRDLDVGTFLESIRLTNPQTRQP